MSKTDPLAAVVTLTSGHCELGLLPELGGCVVCFRVAGVDILRAGNAEALAARDPRRLAAFPLVPFSGRIDQGQFSFGSERIELRRNFPPEPHAIHGHGWRTPWQLLEQKDALASLRFDYEASDWPWSYRAEQHFSLREDGLALSLSLQNLSDRPMPAGLGWHPYFPVGSGRDATLAAPVEQIWPNGEDKLPREPASLSSRNDLRVARPVAGLDLDNCFALAPGSAVVAWPSRKLEVAITADDSLRHLVVYTPQGEDSFCVEPVSHVPNAVNDASPSEVTGQRVLQPGETWSATVALRVTSL